MLNKEQLLLYAVTDNAWTGKYTLQEQIEQALSGGVTLLQLREKNLGEEEFVARAIEVKKICERYNVPLIINDNVEVALRSGADGVHVGIEDMAVSRIRKRAGDNFIIGATAKTVEQAQRAQAEGADYLGVGAVFPSPTKKNAVRITREQLSEITASVEIPSVAIGGITLENMEQIRNSGISGIAVVSAVFSAQNIPKACHMLKEKVKEVLNMRTALSIAGSDSCGGAGIQADIKTMTVNGVYAMTAITALTAQNTTGVTAVYEVPCEFLKKQIEAVFEDIRPDAVKIGMVPSAEQIRTIATQLKKYKAVNIVVDPVMVSTSKTRLMDENAVLTLKEELLPIASLVTPNISEAEILSGDKIEGRQDMVCAAEKISKKYHCNVLLKGGHSVNDADDLLYANGMARWFEGKRVQNPNTHGTGCTLSSAIAAGLAKGASMEAAVRWAKEYITGALAAQLDLGKGSGPLNHAYKITN